LSIVEKNERDNIKANETGGDLYLHHGSSYLDGGRVLKTKPKQKGLLKTTLLKQQTTTRRAHRNQTVQDRACYADSYSTRRCAKKSVNEKEATKKEKTKTHANATGWGRTLKKARKYACTKPVITKAAPQEGTEKKRP